MKSKKSSVRFVLVSSLAVSAALVATVPFNMGGCNASNLNNINVAGMIDAGNKLRVAEGLNQRQERAIGESVSLAATNQNGVTKDERLAQYVVLVGQTVASRTFVSCTRRTAIWRARNAPTRSTLCGSLPHIAPPPRGTVGP